MGREMIVQPRCLIAEDQALIAMSIEAYLEDANIAAHTVGSVAEARAWLEANTAEIAILDLMLKDGPATEFAEDLTRRGIPFIIYSGYSRSQGIHSKLQGVPWLEKPISREDLLKVLLQILVGPLEQAASVSTLNSRSLRAS
jgi:DNA-binding NtrC family response regulator